MKQQIKNNYIVAALYWGLISGLLIGLIFSFIYIYVNKYLNHKMYYIGATSLYSLINTSVIILLIYSFAIGILFFIVDKIRTQKKIVTYLFISAAHLPIVIWVFIKINRTQWLDLFSITGLAINIFIFLIWLLFSFALLKIYRSKMNIKSYSYTLIIILIIAIISVNLLTHFITQKKNNNLTTPNILLITIDALRADHLSCYGYHRKTSPFIDELCSQSVQFEAAITQAPHTYPSLPRMMTSLYDTSLITPLKAHTMAEVLKDKGYISAGIVHNAGAEIKASNPFEFGGLKQGFDHFILPELDSYNSEKQIYARDKKYTAKWVTHEAINFLNSQRNKKFFLWLHYFDPHDPYAPPEEFDKKFGPNYRGPYNGDVRKTANNFIKLFGISRSVLSAEDRQHIIDLYDGEIAYTDKYIGILFNELKRLNLLKDTIIVIGSDHGESLGEHNIWTHGYSLYDTEIRVPLLIYYPSLLPAQKITKVVAQNIDIMPTILAMLDFHIPEELMGTNLLPIITNKSSIDDYYSFSSFESLFCIRDWQYKLIVCSELEMQYEFYNLIEDKNEQFNLYNQKEYKELITKYKKELTKRFPQSQKPNLSMEQIKQLKSIGYIK
jgi:arylsulfatase A-like enzyme